MGLLYPPEGRAAAPCLSSDDHRTPSESLPLIGTRDLIGTTPPPPLIQRKFPKRIPNKNPSLFRFYPISASVLYEWSHLLVET